MASIWKHPESKYWFACFTTAEGKRTKKSTKTTDRALAKKLADQFEEAANKKKTALNTRKVIQELHASITGEDLVFPSVREHVEGWVLGKQGEVAAATLVFYQGVAKKFLTWLGERSKNDLAAITEDHIKDFRQHESNKLTAKTVNHEIKTLKMIFREAMRRKLITDDPTLGIKSLKRKPSTKKAVFSPDQIQRILNACDYEWRSMVMFALYTGQRLIDIASLKSSNISLEKGVISLTTRKTGKMLSIPIAAPLRKHIDLLKLDPSVDSAVHPRASKIVEQQGKSGHLSNQFSSILSKAGLRKKKAHRKTGAGKGSGRDESGLSFHSFRHTAVTRLKEAGVPEAVVMELIGHDSEQMSALYTNVGDDALKKASDSMAGWEV